MGVCFCFSKYSCSASVFNINYGLLLRGQNSNDIIHRVAMAIAGLRKLTMFGVKLALRAGLATNSTEPGPNPGSMP